MAGIRAMHGAIAEALALQAWSPPGTLTLIPAYLCIRSRLQGIKPSVIKVILDSEGKVEAVIQLRKRFHIPLAAAWIFVEKLE